ELDGELRRETDIFRGQPPDSYTAFDRLLEQCLAKLASKQAPEIVQSWLLSQAKEALSGYPQVLSIIESLFKKEGDKSFAIRRMRERLLDALPVWELVPCLEELITTELLK